MKKQLPDIFRDGILTVKWPGISRIFPDSVPECMTRSKRGAVTNDL